MTDAEVGETELQEELATIHLILQHLSMEADKVSFRNLNITVVLSVTYTLSWQRMGEFASLLHTSTPYLVFQTTHLAEREFFLFLKTFIKPRPNQNSNLKNGNRKTTTK